MLGSNDECDGKKVSATGVWGEVRWGFMNGLPP